MADDKLFGKTARGRNAHLLTQDRPHCQLEPFPSSRRTQAGTQCDKRREQAIAGEVSVNRFNIRAKIEQAAYTPDDRRQRLNSRKTNGDSQTLALHQMPYFDASAESVESDGAQISSVFDNLYSGYRPRPQKCEHRVPVIRRPIAQAQGDARFRTRRIRPRVSPQCPGRPVKKLEKDLVKPPHAAEAGRQRNVGNRHLCFVDQLLREKNAPGLRHRDRRRAQMLNKQTPQDDVRRYPGVPQALPRWRYLHQERHL